jgi:hypothetical protein
MSNPNWRLRMGALVEMRGIIRRLYPLKSKEQQWKTSEMSLAAQSCLSWLPTRPINFTLTPIRLNYPTLLNYLIY